MPDWRILLSLLVALAVAQGLCILLAWGLGLRRRACERGALAAGFLLPLLFLAPWLDGSRLVAPSDIFSTFPGAPVVDDLDTHGELNDAMYQFLPWELEVRRAFRAGRLPLWSDLLEGGSSPLGNPQAGALSPIQMIARVAPIQHHLLVALGIKILVAFAGTWLLTLRLGVSRPACYLAAASFALGGGIMSWAVFPHTAAVAWAPWLIAATIGLVRHPSARLTVATAATAAVLLLSGHPEVAAGSGVLAAVCGLYFRRRPVVRRWRGFAAAGLAAVLGFALAAPHLFPFLALLPDSQRSRDMLTAPVPVFDIDPFDVSTWLGPGHRTWFLAPLSPRAFGSPFDGPFLGPFNWAESEAGYTGLVALLGAILALFAARNRRAWPFLAFAVLAFLLAARFLPLMKLVNLVAALRVPAYPRLLLVASLALSVAAAFGLDHILRVGGRRRLVATLAALGVAAASSLLVASPGWLIAIWTALIASVLIAGRSRLAGTVMIAAVLLFDLLTFSRALVPRGHPELFFPHTEIVDFLVQEVSSEPGPWRALGADYLIYPSLLPFYGIADIRPHNPLAPTPLLDVLEAAFDFGPDAVRYFAPFHNLDHPLLDFLNVRAVVSNVYLPRIKTLKRVDYGRFEPYMVKRNLDALPRWFIPNAIDVIEPGELSGWIASMVEPRRVAVFREEVGSSPLPTLDGGLPPINVLSHRPGKVQLSLAAGEATLVATSIPFSSGWRARMAGSRVETLHVNGAFLAVRVPPRSDPSTLTLTFLPPGFIAGLAACALALTLCGGLLWYERRA